MTVLVFVLAGAVLMLLIALAFSRAAARRAVDAEAMRLAESFAREAKKKAEEKAAAAANAAVKEVENATHDELERIARDLASGR